MQSYETVREGGRERVREREGEKDSERDRKMRSYKVKKKKKKFNSIFQLFLVKRQNLIFCSILAVIH
jgi:hypothetical protein